MAVLLLRCRRTKNATNPTTAITPAATPTPMPAFAPLERPDACWDRSVVGIGLESDPVLVGVDVEDVNDVDADVDVDIDIDVDVDV